MESFHVLVNQFLGDSRIQKIRDLARESRSLKICYPVEVPLSRFLTWLLDPTQGHGLQDSVLRALFVAAWSVRSDHSVETSLRNFLSPTNVESQSFDDCLVDREVPLGTRKLDVLVLEPKKKWLVAIEHKYGAREGPKQLEDYKSELERMFPDWKQVLVFLDYEGQRPSVEGWIGLDYVWLVEELKNAESSPWIAASCKAVIKDFRDAIDWDAQQFVHITDETLLEVVDQHRVIFEKMKDWSISRQPFTTLGRNLYDTSDSLDAKSAQQLFKVYWQRRFLWESCFPMLSYAALLKDARKVFPNVEFWPARKCVYFHLPEWDMFDSEDETTTEWAAAVRVRPLANEEKFGKDAFGVMSYVLPRRLPAAYAQEPILKQFEDLRAASMRRRSIEIGLNRYPLRTKKPVAQAEVGTVLVEHLDHLNVALSQVTALALGH